MQKIKNIRSFVVILIILLTVLFFSKTLLQYYHQVQSSIFLLSPLKVVLSFLLYLGYLYLRALSWKSLLSFLGSSINRQNSLSVWFFSEATRYIPGNVWSFASRAYLAQKQKVSRNVSFLVLPVEIATVTLVTSLLSLYGIIVNASRLPLGFTYVSSFLGSVVILVGLIIFQKKIKRLVGNFLEQDLNPKALLTAFVLQIASWSMYGAGTLLLIGSFGNISNPPLLFSSTLLSWLLGYLSIITPMGLGVREAAFVLLVGSQIGQANAVVVAVLSRVILIFAELSILAFLLISRKRNVS